MTDADTQSAAQAVYAAAQAFNRAVKASKDLGLAVSLAVDEVSALGSPFPTPYLSVTVVQPIKEGATP